MWFNTKLFILFIIILNIILSLIDKRYDVTRKCDSKIRILDERRIQKFCLRTRGKII